MKSLAEKLFEEKDFESLKTHFSNTLKTTTDVRIFRVYISYIEQLIPRPDYIQAFDFVLKKLKHHWDVHFFIKKYVDLLFKDDNLQIQDKIEKTRSIYHEFFHTPMKNFNLLWKDYEQFEVELNRTTAKKMTSEHLPIYQKTYRLQLLYQSIIDINVPFFQDSLQIANFYDVIEIEERNVPGFSLAHLHERLNYIYNFFNDKCDDDCVLFCWTKWLIQNNKIDIAKGLVSEGIRKKKNSLFLHFYYARIAEEHRFDELLSLLLGDNSKIKVQDDQIDLILIHYLSFSLRKKGLEGFRSIFKKYYNQEIGPCVYIFVAKTEWFMLHNKDIPFKMFNRAVQLYPNHVNLQEEFLKFLLIIGDVVNARAFYEKFTKTETNVDLMKEYETRHGNVERYFEILDTKPVTNEIKDGSEIKTEKERIYVECKKSFNYFDCIIEKEDVLEKFIKNVKTMKILHEFSFDVKCLINLLKQVNIE